jgi:alpha-tubulin suppressor-like RCC1 family protein
VCPSLITTTTHLRARAFRAGWPASAVSEAVYQFSYGTLAAPVITPALGTYESGVAVSIAGSAGADTFYTTDGSAPTASSQPYTSAFTLTTSATVRAASFRVDWTPSPVAEAAYEVKVAAPAFSPVAAAYPTAQDVAITTATPGATITYTTDGTDPVESGPTLASGATIHVDHGMTIRARAWKAGATPSDGVSATYVIGGKGQVAAGDGHSLALDAAGRVWAWGVNDCGQLGDGTQVDRGVPLQVAGLPEIRQVAAGGCHSLALDSNGRVWAWGGNGSGQLGDGTNDDHGTPTEIPDLESVAAIAAGYAYSLALKSDGTVWAWGQNANGQLGDGTTDNRSAPAQVPGLPVVVAISTTASHALVLGADRSVWNWGANWDGQLADGTTNDSPNPIQVSGLGNDVVAISAGDSHSLALKSDGTVWAWGANWSGQLGDGTKINRATPAPVVGLSDVATIAAAYEHNLVIKSDGTPSAWGTNVQGQLGDGTKIDRLLPIALASPTDVVAAAGSNHSLALTRDGRLYIWGVNELRIGDPDATGPGAAIVSPVAISNPGLEWVTAPPVVTPAGGAYQDEVDVTVSCLDPLVAVFYTTNGDEPTPASTPIACGTKIHIADPTTLRLRAFRDGSAPSAITAAAYTFSVGTPTANPPSGSYPGRVNVGLATATLSGELRYTTDGSEPNQSSPLYDGRLLTLAQSTVIKATAYHAGWEPSASVTFRYTVTPAVGAIAAGIPFSMALTPTGKVLTWGQAGEGELGDGSTENRALPGEVPGLSHVVGIGAGPYHALAVDENGAVWAWGDNTYGQIGNGNSGVIEPLPVAVGGLQNIVAVAGGSRFSLALDRDGHVYAWGKNDAGQLGDGTTEDHLTPGIVPGLPPIVAIAGGDLHCLALAVNGDLWAWGANWAGQLSDAVPSDSLVPIRVSAIGATAAVGAAWAHSLAVSQNGDVWAWGRNSSGQLGDGTTSDHRQPLRVPGLPPVVAIAAGWAEHSLAVTTDGHIASWGANENGQLGDGTQETRLSPIVLSSPTDAVAVAAGLWHSLALTRDGRIFAWGANWAGQLGNGLAGDPALSPVEVSGPDMSWRTLAPVLTPSGGSFTSALDVMVSCPDPLASVYYTTNGDDPTSAATPIACGASIHIADPTTLRVRAFRDGFSPSNVTSATFSFRIGEAVATPPPGTYAGRVLVGIASATPDVEIRYTLDGTEPGTDSPLYSGLITLTETTAVKARVVSERERWAPATSTQTFVYEIAPFAGVVAAGEDLSVALDPTGTIWTWGLDSSGQLGDGRAGSSSYSYMPLAVPGIDDAVGIAAGDKHVLAIVGDGTVMGWGSNQQGQIGNGASGVNQTTPTPVPGVSEVVAVAAGSRHSLALRRDGRVFAWGANESGQLGTGSHDSSPTPQLLSTLENIVAISASLEKSVALGADGRLWQWGTDTQTATPVVTADHVSGIAAGASLSPVTIRSDGSVWQGTDPVPGCDSGGGGGPVVVTRAVAAGWAHALALTSDGRVLSWTGYAEYGELGRDGDPSSACEIPDLAQVVSVAAGSHHSLAVTASGAVWAWGSDSWGQIGSDTWLMQPYPVQVFSAWPVAPPTLTPPPGTYEDTVSVSITSRVPGAVIRYTTDLTEPDETSSIASGPVSIKATKLLRAKTFRGAASSAAVGGLYVMHFSEQAQPPTILPSSRISTGPLVVTMTAAPEATIWYRTGAEWQQYTGPLTLEATTTVEAEARQDGFGSSDSSWATYAFEVAQPVLSPGSGTYAAGGSIAVTCPTLGSAVHYTTDGSMPTESSPTVACDGSLSVGTFRLTLGAWKTGYTPSQLKWADYLLDSDPSADSDEDGLTNAQEALLGTDPHNPDTNSDGISDGAAVALGISPTNIDMDGDGLPNATERAQGTNPFVADTDGDGVPDGLDCFPLDPTQSTCPTGGSADGSPPVIVLLSPSGARLISSLP